MKELKVSAIENGTVIDHIPADSVTKVAKILGVDIFDDMVLIGTNLYSEKLGKKGVIKFANRILDHTILSKIALFAPEATIVTIENYEVISKRMVEIPDFIKGIVTCPNQKCITNHEQIETGFKVLDKVNSIKLRCEYCEKIVEKEKIRVIL